MTNHLHGKLHHQLGIIHTTIESAFLTMGFVLATLITLLVVCGSIWLLER
jgi:heme/copper-type cytochrome/quinol oxidase subunit 4